MTTNVMFHGKQISFFDCKDCRPGKKDHSFRKSGRFCDPSCRDYVLEKKYGPAIGAPARTQSTQEPLKVDETDIRLKALEDALHALKEELREHKDRPEPTTPAAGSQLLNTKHFVEYLRPLQVRVQKLEGRLFK